MLFEALIAQFMVQILTLTSRPKVLLGTQNACTIGLVHKRVAFSFLSFTVNGMLFCGITLFYQLPSIEIIFTAVLDKKKRSSFFNVFKHPDQFLISKDFQVFLDFRISRGRRDTSGSNQNFSLFRHLPWASPPSPTPGPSNFSLFGIVWPPSLLIALI